MNRIVVGLDEAALAAPDAPVLTLLRRLAIADPRVDLVHIMPPATPGFWHFDQLLGLREAERQTQKSLRRAEHFLQERAAEWGAHPDALVGAPVERLLTLADERHASLIALNGNAKNAVEALFTGSVARSVVSGAARSVLIARPQPAALRPLRAVLATDHSPYMGRALESLLTLAPAGLAHVTVLTAFPRDLASRFDTLSAELLKDVNGTVCRSAEERCAETVGRLAPLAAAGTTFSVRVEAGDPRAVIAATMAAEDADLLILGAQGHGFLRRVVLGSVSFDQALGAHAYSVLLLRPTPENEQESPADGVN
jgi:nucleotide-binding universal stress UspA family protein